MMNEWGIVIGQTLLSTLFDILPIIGIFVFFQFVVLRQKIVNLKRKLIGIFYVLLGLGLFLVGLERALFPLGREMARQLTDPTFIERTSSGIDTFWLKYYWVYVFSFCIGFATTIAEPALLAIALKAKEVSGGAIGAWGLRIAVALGVAIALTVGTFRIISGTPLYLYMIIGYIIVIVQTMRAPKMIVPLAYDSGGVTTSTVTVPLVAALGLGLASTVPGRSALLDGFGLIALASLFPMITVMGYAQISEYLAKRNSNLEETEL